MADFLTPRDCFATTRWTVALTAADSNTCESQWFTLADMATARMPEQTLLCTMSGEDLIDIHKRWVEKGELTVVPDYKPEGIDSKRDYRVAMPPWLCGHFTHGWKRNLRDVEAGPEWRQEDLWAEVFGEDAARKAR